MSFEKSNINKIRDRQNNLILFYTDNCQIKSMMKTFT